MTKGEPKDEYREVGENIRHWQSMRFTSMTVFMGVMAGMLAANFQWSKDLTDIVRISVKVLGLLAVVIFWVQDERIVKYWQSYVSRAKVLEEELKFKQYSSTPRRNIIFTSGNAIRLLFLMFSIFWIAALVLNTQF
jgi:phage shock protein PspC (stress-responsive transcriptional regulator)